MKTHTQGPWRVLFGDVETNTIVADNGVVCRVFARQNEVVSPNACLIAAAPELLAALEDATFLLGKAAQLAGPMRGSFLRGCVDAEAIIAKAREG